MRYTQATEILQKLDGYDGGSKAPFAWRKAWLARTDLVMSAVFTPRSPLRQIPNLRYARLLGLAACAHWEQPFEIATSADAIQVGQPGHRLRSFYGTTKKTLKLVREASHYGPATHREIALRPTIPVLLVPRFEGHETKDGFLFVQEELIEGRAYNVRRDRGIFSTQIVEPLSAFHERYGIKMMPLADALGALTPFMLQDPQPFQQPLLRKIAENPQVAVSLCHNDVVPGNLAISARGVYFLDWGSAVYSLCGRDFVRTGRWYLGDAAIKAHMHGHISRLHRGKLGLDDLLLVQDAMSHYVRTRGDMRLETGIPSPF